MDWIALAGALSAVIGGGGVGGFLLGRTQEKHRTQLEETQMRLEFERTKLSWFDQLQEELLTCRKRNEDLENRNEDLDDNLELARARIKILEAGYRKQDLPIPD